MTVQNTSLLTPTAVFPNRGTIEHCQGFREKLWKNKQFEMP
jgi:hypothetical protein